MRRAVRPSRAVAIAVGVLVLLLIVAALAPSIAPFAFPSHKMGVATRQPGPHAATNTTDCFFTQIRHSARYKRTRISSSVWPSLIIVNTDFV